MMNEYIFICLLAEHWLIYWFITIFIFIYVFIYLMTALAETKLFMLHFIYLFL